MTDPEHPDPRALAAVLSDLRRMMAESEADEPHSIIVTDPQTGTRHVIGPYPNRLHAKIGVALTKARNEKADAELADLTYEVVLNFGTDQ